MKQSEGKNEGVLSEADLRSPSHTTLTRSKTAPTSNASHISLSKAPFGVAADPNSQLKTVESCKTSSFGGPRVGR